MPSTKKYVCLKVKLVFFTNRMIIVFDLLLYEYSCWGQDDKANDPLVNKLCINSIILTSIVKRDFKKVTTYDFPVSLRRSLQTL